MRQEDAEVLIRTNALTKEIGYALGYKQTSHFCRHFHETHGVSVTVFRRLQR